MVLYLDLVPRLISGAVLPPVMYLNGYHHPYLHLYVKCDAVCRSRLYLLCFLNFASISMTLLTAGFFRGKHSESEFATVHEGNQSITVFSRFAASLYRLLL